MAAGSICPKGCCLLDPVIEHWKQKQNPQKLIMVGFILCGIKELLILYCVIIVLMLYEKNVFK